MINAATVMDIADPKNLGRIRVRLGESRSTQNLSPWCWPCVPFAGPNAGLYCLPQVGDAVWVERAASGQWVIAGYFWTANNPKPDAGSSTVRVFRTPAGHELLFDESGAIEIRHRDGSTVTLEAGGKIVITSTAGIVLNGSDIWLGGEDGEAVVLGSRLLDFLNGLVQSYNSHSHAAQGSAPPAPISSPSGILSSKVKTE